MKKAGVFSLFAAALLGVLAFLMWQGVLYFPYEHVDGTIAGDKPLNNLLGHGIVFVLCVGLALLSGAIGIILLFVAALRTAKADGHKASDK